MTSLIGRYAARPESLEGMCSAEFASNYDVKYGKTETDDIM